MITLDGNKVMKEVQSTVLIVDDTPTNIQLLNGILGELYKVKVATNGAKAISVAQSEPTPDIILLDIMMSEMDGIEVCRRLKSSPLTSGIPIIFITAKSTVADEQQGFALGAVDYITKPFNPEIVQARIKAQLTLYQQQCKLDIENSELKHRIANEFSDYIEPEIVSILQVGESNGTEFKSTLRWNLHTDKADKKIENACLKTVAAFLNSDSGVLLVGVDDDSHVLGLEQDRFASEDKLLLHWNSLLRSHLGVEFMPLIRSQINALGGQRILLVQCLRSSTPVFFRRDNDEKFFVRTGNGTSQLKPSEVLAYLGQRESRNH